MKLQLWSVSYLPEEIYLEYFEDMLISLSKETEKADLLCFYISGKYYKEGKTLVENIIKNNFYVIGRKNKTSQYVGFMELYLNVERSEYIIFMDGDDLVSKNRTKKMLDMIEIYKCAIVTVASKFYENKEDNDFYETYSEIIPLASENGFIKENDDLSYSINQIFVSGEDTSTMIVPFVLLEDFLLKNNLDNNYSDVEFYKFLVEHQEVLFAPFNKPVYFYRVWDRPNKISIHH